MNKKLLAVAIAAAVAAPYAALADEGNVTLSGNLDASIIFQKMENGDRTTDVSSTGSDLSISGWEPLGNGLKAVFLLKSWINLTGNAEGPHGSDLLLGPNKDAYLGLAGNFGTVALGAHGQPYKTATGGLELFGDTIGDPRGSVTNGQGAFHSGIGDAVIYFMPNMSGFSGHLQYGTENGVDGGANPWGAQVNYSNGPMYVTFAHANADGRDANGDGLGDGKGNKVGAGFTFGSTTVNGTAERTQQDGQSNINAYSLGVAQKFGANTAKLQYATNNAPAGDQTLWAVGLDHDMSKRTKLFALYADGENAGFYNGFEVGMKHSF